MQNKEREREREREKKKKREREREKEKKKKRERESRSCWHGSRKLLSVGGPAWRQSEVNMKSTSGRRQRAGEQGQGSRGRTGRRGRRKGILLKVKNRTQVK